MSAENMEGVLRRVQKLLAIAADPRANAGEAAAAASMAEKVMRKYQLEHADVLAAEIKSGQSKMAMGAVFANMKRDDPKRPPLKTTPAWGQILAASIARLHDADIRHGQSMNKHGKMEAALVFCGFPADVQLCCWTFDYIVNDLIAGVAKFRNQRRKERSRLDEMYHKTRALEDKMAAADFRQGFVTIVAIRLNTMSEEKKAERESAQRVNALVLYDTKQQAIQAAFGPSPERKEARDTPKDEADRRAWAAGFHAGNALDLNVRGLGG